MKIGDHYITLPNSLARALIIVQLVLGGFGIFTVLTSGVLASTPSLPVRFEEILKAWHTRSSGYASGDFEWKEEHMIPKGMGLVTKERRSEVEVYPPKDLTYVVEKHMLFSGSKMRMQVSGDIWTSKATRLRQKRHTDVFNGVKGKGLQEGEAYDGIKWGYITSRNNLSFDTRHIPIDWVVFGPPPFVLKFPSEAWSIKEADVHGIKCYVASVLMGKSDLLLYFDRSDLLPVRCQFLNGGLPQLDILIGYDEKASRDAPSRMPSTWTILEFSENQLSESVRGKMTRYRVNTAISDKEFEMTFPKGTIIHDDDGHEYVVREEGTYEPISEHLKRGVSLAKIISGKDDNPSKAYLVWINVIVLAVLLTVFGYKRLSRHHRVL